MAAPWPPRRFTWSSSPPKKTMCRTETPLPRYRGPLQALHQPAQQRRPLTMLVCRPKAVQHLNNYNTVSRLHDIVEKYISSKYSKHVSVVSSISLGSMLIFAICVIRRPLVFTQVLSFEYIYIYGPASDLFSPLLAIPLFPSNFES